MTRITEQQVDHIYDTIELMNLAIHTLGNGDAGKRAQQSLSWLLGSTRQRLKHVLSDIENLQSELARADAETPARPPSENSR